MALASRSFGNKDNHPLLPPHVHPPSPPPTPRVWGKLLLPLRIESEWTRDNDLRKQSSEDLKPVHQTVGSKEHASPLGLGQMRISMSHSVTRQVRESPYGDSHTESQGRSESQFLVSELCYGEGKFHIFWPTLREESGSQEGSKGQEDVADEVAIVLQFTALCLTEDPNTLPKGVCWIRG